MPRQPQWVETDTRLRLELKTLEEEAFLVGRQKIAGGLT
jgi:hypothetical protein